MLKLCFKFYYIIETPVEAGSQYSSFLLRTLNDLHIYFTTLLFIILAYLFFLVCSYIQSLGIDDD